ncbi:MAG: alpha/beta hydrolase-fold protein [Planctomycetaceae bacterium]|nr:alpha/beta hydrolase-fold protein [Planctomycetaceae bacterium]
MRFRWNACLSLVVVGAAVVTLGDVTVVCAQPAPTAAGGKFVDHVYRDAEGEHKYVVFEPAGYTPEKKWPLVFYLHGASGRGRDGRAQLVVGLGPAVKARAATLPFLVVFPQNENLRSRLLGGWTDGSNELPRALKILDEVERTYSVDRQHEILAGVSMGAFGAWSVAAESPTRWKAVIAVSGGGEPEFVPALTKVPVWAFHAADDQLVPPTRSTGLVEAINAAGGRAYVSIVPRGGHNIGAAVLARDEVFAWLEHPETAPNTNIDWSQRAATADLTDEIPFIPGAEVETAARIRLNSDLLDSLSYVVAERVPADALQGWKPGRFEQQRSGLMSIDVTVGGMHYAGRLEQARITPLASGHLRVQLGLRDLTMTITGTRLQSRLLSAQAGPMAIYIGHRETVWLTVDVLPYVVDRQLKLQLASVDFHIPHHNWSISRPGVDVRGMPFLEGRIADRLVEGIAEKKGMIEQEIRNGVPQMLTQMEPRLAAMWSRTVTHRHWPMPLWQPRFRFYPEAVTVNEQGIELRLGATVAALAPKSATVPLLKFPADADVLPIASNEGIDVAASMRLIDAYSTLLASSDVARFHVLDMSGEGFHRLGRHAFWNAVLPADRRLPETTELSTEVVVTKPFQLRTLDDVEKNFVQGDVGHRLAVGIPQMQLQLATREPGQSKWTDAAVVDLAFAQVLRLGIEHRSFAERKFDLQFETIEPPRVEARLLDAGSSSPLNVDHIAAQFHDAWSNNFGRTERERRMADVKLGQLTLRWQDIGVTDRHFVVRLLRPGIRVYNKSDAVVEYQVRGPLTPWSEAWRLAPGQHHEFRTATPITWKTLGPSGEQVYTLPLGFEAQIRSGAVSGAMNLYEWSDGPIRR